MAKLFVIVLASIALFALYSHQWSLVVLCEEEELGGRPMTQEQYDQEMLNRALEKERLRKLEHDTLVQDINKIEWWKKTNFYHIYIRSFKDTDGNGQGDLRGVVEKLDYLKLIGVETLLLSPFYSSPMKDGGYDVDDYTAINKQFGSMQDFDDLLSGLKKRSMRLVVDFVPNHSSNKHKWFKCSERAYLDPKNCSKYKDYYIWSNATNFENSRPNNWISLFGGQTAWRWSPIRKEFYFHQFLPEQPDLNLRNPLVREEFKEIVRFWLRKGVDGIRVDAVLHFLEDQLFRDEPEDPMWKPDWDPYDRLLHIYTRSLYESATVVRDWWMVANEPEFGGNRLIITEAYDKIKKIMDYYGPRPELRFADLPFDFELFNLNEINISPGKVESILLGWLNATRELAWPDKNGAIEPWSCWVTGNHDNKRIVNRVGHQNAEAYKWIAYFAPGVPVAYYGDEIGMHDSKFNSIPQKTIEEGEPTRLVFRAPMAWNSEEPAGGFSNNSNTWMPMNSNYKSHNVAEMLKSPGKNFLKNFIQLQKIRRDFIETLTFGELTFFTNLPADSSMVFAMARAHPKFGSLLMLANFDRHEREIVRLTARAGGPAIKTRVSPYKYIPAFVPGSKMETTTTENLIETTSSSSSNAIKSTSSNSNTNNCNRNCSPDEQTSGYLPKRGKILMLNYQVDGSALAEGAQVELDGLVLAPSQTVLIQY